MVELLRALQLIFDSILAVRTGRLQHLISLSGQLRALLTERSSKADRLIDWSAPRHLQASVTIDEDLTTLLELVIDGERVGRSRVPQPLFVLSDPMHYDSYHNRAVDGKEQDFSFGVIEVVMYGSEVPPVGRANLLLHFEEKC
jgi:hypothetical protein